MVIKTNYKFSLKKACLKNSSNFIKKDKLGQIKIQQMIFMILAVGFLFMLVGLIFLSMTLKDIKGSAAELSEKNSMLLVSKLSNSPEFSCGNAFSTSRSNCIDFDKLIVLRENIEKYSNFWGVAKIELRKIYPSSDVECQKGNYPECGIIHVLDKQVDILPYSSVFVSLCRKESNEYGIYDKCELARLMIASEDKK